MSGKFVGILADKAEAGKQELTYNTSQLTPGTYLYQITYQDKFQKGKILIK